MATKSWKSDIPFDLFTQMKIDSVELVSFSLLNFDSSFSQKIFKIYLFKDQMQEIGKKGSKKLERIISRLFIYRLFIFYWEEDVPLHYIKNSSECQKCPTFATADMSHYSFTECLLSIFAIAFNNSKCELREISRYVRCVSNKTNTHFGIGDGVRWRRCWWNMI